MEKEKMNEKLEKENLEAEDAQKAEAKVEDKEESKDCENTEPKEQKEQEDDDKFRRLMADFQNYKKRTEKERKDIYAYANEQIVSELLLVLDNFERALEHDTEDKKYVEGMQLIFKQLKDTLIKAGLEEIKALGEDFDPNFHNAVMTEENSQFESGKVTAELQKGYTLNGKVIRATMVKVNQ